MYRPTSIFENFITLNTLILVREDKIVIGDVNAEIHVLDRKPNVPLSQDSFQFLLEKGHYNGAYNGYPYIWAVEIDATRIFSGDSDACLVVHDFWEQETETENSTETTATSSPKKLKLDPESSSE